MKRFILFWALLVFIAAPVWAADTNKYPSTLMDQTCTDSYDAPAAYTPSFPHVIGGNSPVVSSAALIQTSGSGDGYCDNDSRIITGNVVADTLLGPFQLPDGARGFVAFLDVITISGGGSNDMNMRVYFKKPHNAEDVQVGVTGTIDAVSDVYFDFGPDAAGRALGGTTEVAVALTKPFYIHVNLLTATLLNAELSLLPYYY